MSLHACTIVARNYWAAARILARSFGSHHPTGTFTTLVIDDLHGEVSGENEPFDVVRPGDLDLDSSEVNRLAASYDLMELATALKPWLLDLLRERWGTEVIYLDPDIVVYSPLDDIGEMAAQSELVLTPHVTKAMARDGLTVNESHILASGTFNLGFIAVGRRSTDFLTFWMERLRRECVIEPLNMRFVDQRWLDFAPGLFDVTILRDPACNVAYWNLGQRKLTWEADRYLIDGRPLRFFHFSGYNPRRPEILSHHQGNKPRILLSELPILEKICTEYAELLRAEGYERGATTPYGYARLDNGLKLDRSMRIAYRKELIESEENDGQLPPNPFEDAMAFLDWLNAAEPAHRLSRYTAALWLHEPELRERFPSAEYRDRDAFLQWCGNEAAAERIDYRLVPEAFALSRGRGVGAISRTLRGGFRIAGDPSRHSGAEFLRDSATRAVQASGIPYALYPSADSFSSSEESFGSTKDDFIVNLLCVEPVELSEFAWQLGPEFFADRYTIALWDWAFEGIPEAFKTILENVDEIWVTTAFALDAIGAVYNDKPVFLFPVPIYPTTFEPSIERSALVLRGGPIFFSSFDMQSGFERANPMGALEAFDKAFSPGEGPVLAIEVTNGESDLARLEKLRLAASKRPDVAILGVKPDADRVSELLAASTCCVSLHRSDGFSPMIAKAMLLGKPVIATGYSGSIDLMAKVAAYPVPFRYGKVPAIAELPNGTLWAEPELEAASEFMRHVVGNPSDAKAVGARARIYIESTHSSTLAAVFVRDRLHAAQIALAERYWVSS